MDKSIILQSKKESCPKFQIKKTLALKHGQINATISQVSMFHMFLYIIGISIELPKSFQRLKGAACVCSYWSTKDYKAACTPSLLWRSGGTQSRPPIYIYSATKWGRP